MRDIRPAYYGVFEKQCVTRMKSFLYSRITHVNLITYKLRCKTHEFCVDRVDLVSELSALLLEQLPRRFTHSFLHRCYALWLCVIVICVCHNLLSFLQKRSRYEDVLKHQVMVTPHTPNHVSITRLPADLCITYLTSFQLLRVDNFVIGNHSLTLSHSLMLSYLSLHKYNNHHQLSYYCTISRNTAIHASAHYNIYIHVHTYIILLTTLPYILCTAAANLTPHPADATPILSLCAPIESTCPHDYSPQVSDMY